jgi:hypothetical protein
MKKFLDGVKDYAHNVLVMLTQSFNVLTGGMPDETFCSRMWRKKMDGSKFGAVMVWILNHIFCYEFNHCEDSYMAEVEHRHVPKEVISGELVDESLAEIAKEVASK